MSEIRSETSAQSINNINNNNKNKPQDLMLSCLVWFTQYFHKPFSEQALSAGLPLVNHILTLDLLPRAAERAHLTVTSREALLTELAETSFPALILLNDNKPLILLGIHENTAELLDPELGMGVIQQSVSLLEKAYAGTVIFIKSTYEFTERSQEKTEKIEKTEKSSFQNQSAKKWFWQVILKVWPLYSEVLAASLLINLFALAVPLFSMNVYDRVVPNEAVETLWVLALGVSVVFLFDFGMRVLRSYFIDIAGKTIDIRLSAQIFEQIMGIRMNARPTSIGAFANTIQSFESFRDFITSSTVTVLVDLPFVFIFILIIAFIGGSLAWVPLISVPLVMLVGWLIQIPLTSLTTASYQYANEKQAALIETLSGVETIKTIGAESPMQKRWEQVNHLSAHLGIKLRVFSNLNTYFSVIAQQFAYILVIIWGVYKISAGELTTGGLIACSILTSRALAPMSQVTALLMRYYQTRHSLEALNTVMGLPVERPQGQSLIRRPVLKGAIEFQQVNFAYSSPKASPNQALSILKNVSFKISPGEKVGIIGRMGSGKTTITKLILNLYQPASGLILVDGLDQRQIDIAELRHNMGYVSQDVMLFYGSIKDNIVLGAPHIEDAAILKAAQISGVESFTRLHPQGLEMQVGERGAHLSGGQRQCVAVARAILLDPPIILFDEATSGMDDKTEQLLKNSLSHYLQPKTLILVTHKASMLSMVNRLIIVEAGQIIADGPKDEILQLLAEGKIKAPAF